MTTHGRSQRAQHGLTLIGLLFVSAVVGGVAVVGMKLFPLYNERFKVLAAMESVAGRPDIGSLSADEIRRAVLKFLEIEDVDYFDSKNIRQALKVQRRPNGQGRVMVFTYEIRRPLFGDLDVVMNFSQSREIPGGVEGGP